MFDGDEMTMFVPQCIQTQLELANIADVKRQIITPKTSTTIIKFKQDTVIGCYKLTETNNNIDYKDVMNLLMNVNNNIDIFEVGKETINSHQLFSYLIPKSINSKIYNDDKVIFEIKNGQLLKGTIEAGSLNNRIVYNTLDREGNETAKHFFDNTQRLIANWLLMHGFTVGYGDAKIDPEVLKKIKDISYEKQLEINHLITQLENNPDLMDDDALENDILGQLRTIGDNIAGIINKSLNSSNNFYSMVKPDAKGKPSNIGQIMGVLGQSNMQNKRIQNKVNGRSTVHYYKNDDSANARGYIHNSFFSGLTPTEFYFHHMSGREGLIDTAIKSVTGDTKIIIMENDVVKHTNIGEWIDNLLMNNNDIKIDNENNEYREYIELDNETYIPTTDLDGKISWQLIKAITRHNPSYKMFNIKTKSGRTVTVTDSHSLLVWRNDKLERIKPEFININDLVPVTKNLMNINNNNEDSYRFLDEKNNNDIELFINKIFKNNNYYCNNESELYMINMILNRVNKFADISYDRDLGNYILSINDTYQSINDIILDPIIEINEIVSYDKKVYDLTIPSTLNFCLANGLHVVDTADSGYLQRKLIKGMEDIMVAYDGTVRSGNNVIMQFIYGDNYINMIYLKNVLLRVIKMSDSKIKTIFGLTDEEMRQVVNFSPNLKDKIKKLNQDYINRMMEYRNELRIIDAKSRHDYITLQENFKLPCNFNRIIEYASNVLNNKNTEYKILENQPLTYDYILDRINYILSPEVTSIVCMKQSEYNKSNTFKYKNQLKSKYLLEIALYEYLSPKKCLFEYKFNKQQFDIIIIEIINSFNKSIVEYGEMVGIVTAQTLGETLTQLTLNSVAWNEKILYYTVGTSGDNTNKECNVVEIGHMIDSLLESNKDKVINVDNNTETEYLDIKHLNYHIQSVDEYGKLHWKLIEAITRHLPGGNVVKIKTLSGREVVATKAKSFLIRRNNKIEEIEGSELKTGDRLPIQLIAPKLESYLDTYMGYTLDTQFGYKVGKYLVNNENNKELSKLFNNGYGWLVISNKTFINSIIHVCFNNYSSFVSDNKDLLVIMTQLLNVFRYKSIIRDNSVIVDLEDYIISGVNIKHLQGEYHKKQLLHIFEYTDDNDIKELLKQTLNEDVYYDEIVEINDLPLEEITPEHNKVYDFTVADTKNFNMFNGLCMRDTFHQAGRAVAGMQGIPRLKEILSYSKNISTPLMTIKFLPEIRKDSSMVHKIKSYLRHTQLNDLIIKLEIVYDPTPNDPTSYTIKDEIATDHRFNFVGGSNELEHMPWLYRLTISRESMLEYDMTLMDIKTRFMKSWMELFSETNKKKTSGNKVIGGLILSNFE